MQFMSMPLSDFLTSRTPVAEAGDFQSIKSFVSNSVTE